MNLISIIIPYFNKKKFILSSVKSVLRQTYKNFEIIIIYDDKDKKDLPYIRKICRLDKKIKLIINKKNLGAGISRNIGIARSQGNFIAFLDSDDVWRANKLELQMRFMKQQKADFSFTSYDLVDSINQKIGRRKAKPFLHYGDLIKSCDIGLSTVIIKKKLFNGYCKFPDLKTKEDYVLWLKLAQKKIILRGLNIALTQWRVVNNSLSKNSIQKIFDAFSVYNKYMKFNFFKSCQCVFILSLNYIIKKYL